MTCRELVDFLMDYVEGTLEPKQRQAFERHLAVCPSCVAYVESYRRTSRLAAAIKREDEPVPPSVPEGLVRAVLAARQRLGS